MTQNRLIILILVILVFLAFGGYLLLYSVDPPWAYETQTHFFRSLTEARELYEGGWLPDDLPRTTTDLYEKHDMSDNTGMIALRFAPEDFQDWATNLTEIPNARIDTVVTRWLPTSEQWFEKAIRKRKFNYLIRNGFRIYEYDWDVTAKSATPTMKSIAKVYFVIHPTKGIAYIWHFPVSTEVDQPSERSVQTSEK